MQSAFAVDDQQQQAGRHHGDGAGSDSAFFDGNEHYALFNDEPHVQRR